MRRRTNRLLDQTGAGRELFGKTLRELFEEACKMTGGRLEGKVAIITGASTGLGPVMAKMFVREGARVLLAAAARSSSRRPPRPPATARSRCAPT